MNTKLVDNIDWVGFVDWNVRDFHGYETSRGSTYNAYLIRDEKTVLLDTVKAPYYANLLRNVSELVPLDQIDYVVCNHAEPDHSGSLPRVMEACPQAVVVCDQKCRETLEQYYDTSAWTFQVVKTGDELKTGRFTLQFVETPMAHWPDSMATYIPEEKILFSMDAFGQHYATSGRYDDEVSCAEAIAEAKTYYANILMCYERPVSKALDYIDNLDVTLIAPSHGVMWRKHVTDILAAYRDWVVCKPEPKVLIMYDTMWKSTEQMAQAIYEGVLEKGVRCDLRYIRATHITVLATEIMDAATVAVGSATLNQTLMPQCAAALTYLMGLRPARKAGFAFGSYGWGKGGPEAVQEYLDKMKIRSLREPLKGRYAPDEAVLEACRAAGRMLAEEALKICEQQENGESPDK